MFKKILLVVLIAVPSVLLSKEVLLDKVISVVNDEIVTQSDLKTFEKTLKSRKAKMEESRYSHIMSSQKNMLNEMINDRLIMQFAKDNGFNSSNEEITEFINSRMRSMGMTQRDLDKQLKDSGQSYDEFRSELRLERAKADIFERDLKKKIEVSEADFETFFKNEFKQDVDIKEYHIKYILFKAESDALFTKNSIKKNNSNFDDIFKNNKGVDLGFINLNDLNSELMSAVKSMNPGDVNGPVSTKTGYYIVRVVGVRNTKNPEYIKNKELIERELVQKNFNRLLDDWLNQRKEESYVKINV